MPKIIDLSGPDGNVFALIGIARRSYKQLGKDPDEISNLLRSAKSYNEVLDLFEEHLGEFFTLQGRE